MKTKYSLLAAVCGALCAAPLLGQPTFVTQPTNQSVSVGANVQFRVAVSTGTPNRQFQWWFKDAALDAVLNPSATGNILRLTNVTAAMAGDYWAVLTDDTGSVTSQVAQLTVDPTFTKITQGAIVTDKEMSGSANWWDFDNDGELDLFVARAGTALVANTLYHNEGNGTFTKVTPNPLTAALGFYYSGTVGDFDNDGFPDLFVADFAGADDLFRNNGQGTFTRLTQAQCGAAVGDSDWSVDATWVDYDCDGFLDLFTVNEGRLADDCLYRNRGDGTFVKLASSQVGTIVSDGADGYRCSWADCDNDGYPDVWVHNMWGPNAFYHNNGNGTFTLITEGSVPAEGSANVAGLWADYDNDGLQDLFTTGEYARPNALHRNLGGNLFTEVAASAGLALQCDAYYGAWGDYDNDGFLDMFVARHSGTPCALFRNNGDGTFRSVEVGSPLIDGDERLGVAWGDCNNDGFLDLFIACGLSQALPNLLYRNNGTHNGWLKLRLEGTTSNRSALGAKVRIKATIGGKTFWQMRELSGNSGLAGGQGLMPHFGLGDATAAEVVRIEWPSGIVQELSNVTAKQILTVTEPTELVALGEGRIWVRCWKGMKYEVEVSNDLTAWNSLGVFTNETGRLEVTDAGAAGQPYRFYRAIAR